MLVLKLVLLGCLSIYALCTLWFLAALLEIRRGCQCSCTTPTQTAEQDL